MKDVLILDIETPIIQMNNMCTRLVCLGMWYLGKWKKCVVIDHNKHTDFQAMEEWKKFFLEFDGVIVGHNLQFDIGVLFAHGFRFPKAKLYDTMLALKQINENESRFSLKVWGVYLGMEPWGLEFWKQANEVGVENTDIELLIQYNIGDLNANYKLYNYCEENLPPCTVKEFELENTILPYTSRLKLHGLGTDAKLIKKKQEDTLREVTAIEKDIKQSYGDINLNSPKQLSGLLYDVLKLPLVGGKRSTSEDILKVTQHPIADQILKYRELTKRESTFFRPILENSIDGVLYPNLFINGTGKGRHSSSGPNIQNLPEVIRVIFIPRNGMYLWVDLDQLEFKISADVSHETRLIDAINSGYDPHEGTALLMFGSKEKQWRSISKTINYAKMYQSGLGKIMKIATCSREKAQELVQTWDANLPNIAAYINAVKEYVKVHREINSPFGRVRRFPYDWDILDYRTKNQLISRCQRQGLNFIIQSMGHSLLSLLWDFLAKEFEKQGILYNGVEWANEVHDELVLDIKPELLQQVGETCQKGLDKLNELCYNYFQYEFKVKLTGSIKYGDKWE